MKRKYYDYKLFRHKNGPGIVYAPDAELAPAGTEIYAMPMKDKTDEYESVSKKTGIHFIFEDEIPMIPFYSVPYLCVFATDGGDGCFACRQIPDISMEEPVYYIPGKKKIYRVAESLEELISNGHKWQDNLRQTKRIKIYDSRAAAEKNECFFDESMIDNETVS